MSNAEMEQLFAGLAGEGTTEARGVGFTLESAKAREKLQEFALAQPENYQLLAIAGLYALGCRHFSLTIDADDFTVGADRPLPREPFQDLWSFVSRGSEDSMVVGCRLLAMAILTSVRLDEMVWKVESSDPGGSWRHSVTVRRGVLSEIPPATLNEAVDGVLLSAKRKAFSQIARRFVARWWAGKQDGADEALIRHRLFLPRGASLVCNGTPLLSEEPANDNVLAVMQTGQAPTLVNCPTVFHRERDYSMCLLLCHPRAISDPRVPGQSNQTLWIWNGLRMDSTTLGPELECIRAFVWAAELRPDLSFTSLVDNRDKQNLERTARSMARELLDRWVRALSEEIRDQPKPDAEPFRERLDIVRTAISHRIDVRKDWKRLASLNSALVECPLMVASGPDGVRRWINLTQIRDELQIGKPVAAFSGRDADVPPWPDRPLVLYSDEAEGNFLRRSFAGFSLIEGQSVLDQVERLRRGSFQPPESAAPQAVGVEPTLSGSASAGDYRSTWTFHAGLQGEPGRLLVRRLDGSGFADSLGLPNGFVATIHADLAQSYNGRILDSVLSSMFRRALLTSFSQAIAASDPLTPTLKSYNMAALLLANKPGQLDEEGRAAPWLVVSTPGGERRKTSPDALRAELELDDIPLYTATWADRMPANLPRRWASVPVVLAPSECESALELLLGRPCCRVSAFELLRSRPGPSRWDLARFVWTGTLEGAEASALSPALGSLAMGIASFHKGARPTTRVETSLCGYFLHERSEDSLYPFLKLAVDWADGWPDKEGRERVGGPSAQESKAILRGGCLILCQRFFAQATPGQIYDADPDLVGILTFDLLSEPRTAQAKVLLLASGEKVSLAEVTAPNGVATYYTDRPGPSYWPEAVYLPGPMKEAIEMLSELSWVAEVERTVHVAPAPVLDLPEAREAPPPPPPASEPVHPEFRLPASQGRLPAVEVSTVSASTTRTEKLPNLTSKGRVAAGPPENAALPPGDPWPAVAPLEIEGSALLTPPAAPSPAIEEEVSSASVALGPAAVALETAVVASEAAARPPDNSVDETPGSLLAEDFLLMATTPDLGYAQFLRRVGKDETSPRALRVSEGQPILGKPALKALATRRGRLFLLSALYSLYNRQRNEVTDQQEREFHSQLMRTALERS